MDHHAVKFLQQTPPFSFLSGEVLARVAQNLVPVAYPAGTVLGVQGKQRLDDLFIIRKGAVEFYFEENGEKKLSGLAGPGESFGGIAILVNEGYALRTIRVMEAAEFYLLPSVHFLELCRNFPEFSHFFTDRLGRNLLDKSYLALVARMAAARSDAVHPPFYHLPVERFVQTGPAAISQGASIREAAQLMNQLGHTYLLLSDHHDRFVGIVTDQDFREKVVAVGRDTGLPVREMMSAPLICISHQDSVLDAVLLMAQHNIKHLAVTDATGAIIGVTSHRRLLLAQGQAPVALVGKIRDARSPTELRDVQPEIATIAKDLIAGGARSDHLTRLITTIADAVLQQVLKFALTEMGPPPLQFAFLLLGSEGRREQTLKTDQDNAIIYEDPDPDKAAATQQYFLQLGEKVCGWLNDAGYQYCRGNVMAQNPRWCGPLAMWKDYFRNWIRTPEPRAVMHATIFFDFYKGYGASALVEELRSFLFEMLKARADTFFLHLANNALQLRPPLGFFRHFVVESAGAHQNEFDIKKAMTPLVDFARAYALQHQIAATNTLERLSALGQMGVLQEEECRELTRAFQYLMQVRLAHQVNRICHEKAPPTNYLNPARLSRIEQKLLKEIFSLLREYQEKMRIHFKGMMW